MLNLLLDAGAEAGGGSLLATMMPMVLIFVVFYFLLIRPQRKRDKQAQEMRAAIDVGDEIVTIGGIIGLVVVVKDDFLVIETGNDRSKIRVARWAVQTNNTPKEAPVVEEEPKKSKKRKKGEEGEQLD